MYTRIRTALLLSCLCLVLISAYYVITKFQKIELPTAIRVTEEGVNVVIENFKVTHEEDGRVDWTLRAESAQVNKEKSVTHLQKVYVTVDRQDNKKFWIVADRGVYLNDSREFELEGHVHLTADSDVVLERLNKNKNESKATN